MLAIHLVMASTSSLFIAGPPHARADAVPFSRIIVFGDSLSDTGNFYQLTGDTLPPAPYYQGRFSNGPLWIEYLATALGMQVFPGDNYAVAGATTGHDNSNDGILGQQFPGLQDEIGEFMAAHQAREADPDALYVVWAGANDFFSLLKAGGSPKDLISIGVSNTIQAIETIRGAGARHLLVVNVPDLGLTPFGLSSGKSGLITQLCAAYNDTLDASLGRLTESGVATIQVDAFATLQAMVHFQAQFGFTNVSEPFLSKGGDPDQFLFWDAVHPTTRGHQVLAADALKTVVDFYSPRSGLGNPPALANCLNGLVSSLGTP